MAEASRSGEERPETPRDRATLLISGLVAASVAMQEARTVPEIFRVARARLNTLGLSVYFAEVRGDHVLFFENENFFRDVAEQAIARRGGQLRPFSSAPIQQAIRNHPNGVLLENFRALVAQITGRSLAEVSPEVDPTGVGAAIYVAGKMEFTITASGHGFDSTFAPAFGLFARQLGHAIETSRRLEEMARSNRELMIVNHVAHAAATLGSGRALEEAMGWLARSLGIDGVALLRAEDTELVLAVHAGMPEGWVAQATRGPITAPTPWSNAARGEWPRTFTLRREHDAVALPLRTGDDLQGVLIASREGNRLKDDELRLLVTVGAQFAVSLQNERLFQQTQRRVRELSLLLELGQAVSGSLEQREIMQSGVQVAARVLRCSAAYIFVPDESQTSLACAAREDPLSAISPAVRMPLDRDSLTGLAFRTGLPQLSVDASTDPRIHPEMIALFGTRSALAVPLRSHQRTLGVLTLIERSADQRFSEQDTRVAVHAAQLLAASVENASLYTEQRHRAEEMTLLNDAARSLAGSLDLEPLLSRAAEALRQVSAATHCLVWLLNAKTRTLHLGVTPANLPQLANMTVPLDAPSAVATAVQANSPVQIFDATKSKIVMPELVRMLNSQTVLAVPLVARGEMLGGVVLHDVKPGRVFSPAEIERASAFAGQIAMAVITARLIEDLRRSYNQLERTQTEMVDRERLAVLGELSASIAHEVRNPLGVIFNALGSLRRMLKQEGNIGMLLGIIGEEADRLNRMVGDLLDYSRPYKPTLGPVLLAPIVADAVASAHTQSGRGANAPTPGPSDEGMRISIRISDQLTLRADQRLLRQALINLFLNAFQAMPKGGKLDVLAEPGDGARPEVWIRIRDTGPGIPPNVRARIFHPFFTTKATGTGLGLAVVKRIIDGHGGRIALREGEGPGAEFEIWLPLEE